VGLVIDGQSGGHGVTPNDLSSKPGEAQLSVDLFLGLSGHRRSLADAFVANGDHVVGFFEDGQPVGTHLDGMLVLGALSLACEWDGFLAGSD
jgi:hypothetical protein